MEGRGGGGGVRGGVREGGRGDMGKRTERGEEEGKRIIRCVKCFSGNQ